MSRLAPSGKSKMTSQASNTVATTPSRSAAPPSERSGRKRPMCPPVRAIAIATRPAIRKKRSEPGGGIALRLRHGVARDLVDQRSELLVAGDRELPLKPLEPVRMPVAEVDHQRPQAPRVEADAHHVDRGREKRRIDVDDPGQRIHRRVGGDQVPRPVDGNGRVGLMAAEDHVERVAHRPKLGVLERTLGKGWGVARRE